MTFDLEILVPDSVVVRQRVRSLQATDASGRFGIWPGHQELLTLVAPCVLVYRGEEDREHYAAADGGVLLLEEGRVSIVTREAVTAERLEDVAAAAAAMLAARRQSERAAREEFAELQTALLRELGEMGKRP
jgi:F-type H+-transporting ATPase subunit epsilon